MSSRPTLTFSADQSLYLPKAQTYFSVRDFDWRRLKRRVACIKPPARTHEVISAASFGICGSSLVSLLALWGSTGAPPWAVPLTSALLLSSLIVGAMAEWYSRNVREASAVQAAAVLEDMAEIEQSFLDNPPGDHGSNPAV